MIPEGPDDGLIQDSQEYFRNTFETLFEKSAQVARESGEEGLMVAGAVVILTLLLTLLALTVDRVWTKVVLMFKLVSSLSYLLAVFLMIYFDTSNGLSWRVLRQVAWATVMLGLIVHQWWEESFGKNAFMSYVSVGVLVILVIGKPFGDVTFGFVGSRDWESIVAASAIVPCQGMASYVMMLTKMKVIRNFAVVTAKQNEEKVKDVTGWGLSAPVDIVTALTALWPMIITLHSGTMDQKVGMLFTLLLLFVPATFVASGVLNDQITAYQVHQKPETQQLAPTLASTGAVQDVADMWKTTGMVLWMMSLAGLVSEYNFWMPFLTLSLTNILSMFMSTGRESFGRFALLTHPIVASLLMAMQQRDVVTSLCCIVQILMDYRTALTKDFRGGRNSLLSPDEDYRAAMGNISPSL